MKLSMTQKLSSASMMVLGCLTSTPASGQSTGGGLEDIVVTARRVEERLQNAPVAVTALSAAMLESRQVDNLTEVVRFTPNVQFSTAASGTTSASSVFVRGIGQIDFITTAEPGVGLYLDGVYLARVTGAALELADVERVEVLRGPQGTLYGRNTIGGAINVVTKSPSDTLEGNMRISVGNQGRIEGRGSISGPLTEGVSARLSALVRTDDGYGRNLVSQPGNSQRLGSGDDFGARLQLRLAPTERLEINLSADYMRRRGAPAPHTMVAFQDSPATAAYNAIPGVVPIGPQFVNTDLNQIQLSTPMVDNLDVWGVGAIASYEFDSATIKSITSYRQQNGQSGQDFDGSPATFLDQFVDSEQYQFSQELQASGSGANGKLDWIMGLYYFFEKGRFDSDISLSNTPVLIFTANRTKSFAAYGQFSYEIATDLRLTAGARYTYEEKFVDGVNTFFGPFELVPPTDLSDSFRNFAPKIGLDYRATEDLLLYGSITRGFRSGGFNGRPFSPADLTSFAAETVTSYEAGVKSEWLDRRLRLNVAAFYNDYDDIQLTAVTNSGGASIVRTGNAASAAIYGIELEFEARPTEGLNLFASAGFMNNTLSEKEGFTFGATELPTAPRFTGNLGGEYRFDISSNLDVLIGADVSHTSSFTPQFDPAPTARIPAYSLVNGRVTLLEGDGGWSIGLFVKNLFDVRYRTYAQFSGSQDATVAWFGPSRRFGLQAGLNF